MTTTDRPTTGNGVIAVPDPAFPLREAFADGIGRRKAIIGDVLDWREAARRLHAAGELTADAMERMGLVEPVQGRPAPPAPPPTPRPLRAVPPAARIGAPPRPRPSGQAWGSGPRPGW